MKIRPKSRGLKAPWKPILEGSNERQAWRFIEKIDQSTALFEKNFQKESNTPWWIDNTIGAALFSNHLYKVSGEKQHKKRAESFLRQGAELLYSRPSLDKLYSGFTGLAWLSEHLRRSNKSTRHSWGPGQDPNTEIDKYLLTLVRSGRAKGAELGRYSLVDTWAGYGIYATERWPSGKANKLLGDLISFFDKKAKHMPTGSAWYSTKSHLPFPDAKRFLAGNFNLGVAHGVPGVIGFLTEAFSLGIKSPALERLLNDSIRWLLAQDKGESFRFYVPPRSFPKASPPPRLAWCYGDLGISMVLLNAAEVLKDPLVKKSALHIAKRAAGFSRSKSKVGDPYICHGAAGAFHIFNHLFQRTKDPHFLDRALFWVTDMFEQLEGPLEVGEDKFGILLGDTGIALSLLAGVSDVSPEWDRLLLLSRQL